MSLLGRHKKKCVRTVCEKEERRRKEEKEERKGWRRGRVERGRRKDEVL